MFIRDSYCLSQAATTRQSNGSAQVIPYGSRDGTDLTITDPVHRFDSARAEPDRVISARSSEPGVAAATPPGWREFNFGKGRKALVPVNEEGWTEGLQSLPYHLYPMWIHANKEFYGPEWSPRTFWPFLPRFAGKQRPVGPGPRQ